MLRSINEIGRLTGKQTIVEWEENAEIIEVLSALGVACHEEGTVTFAPKRAKVTVPAPAAPVPCI